MKDGGKKMKRTQLPEELIEDYKSNVMIPDLCKKYGLTRYIVRDQLMKMGIKEKATHGGCRRGCGRKRIDKDSELQRIREQNKRSFTKSEGVKVTPKFRLW